MKTLIIKIAVLLGFMPMASQACDKQAQNIDTQPVSDSNPLLALQFQSGYFTKATDGAILIDPVYKQEILDGYVKQEKYATEVVDLLKNLLDDDVNVIGLDDVDHATMATQDWYME